jgi:hypothetical protein
MPAACKSGICPIPNQPTNQPGQGTPLLWLSAKVSHVSPRPVKQHVFYVENKMAYEHAKIFCRLYARVMYVHSVYPVQERHKSIIYLNAKVAYVGQPIPRGKRCTHHRYIPCKSGTSLCKSLNATVAYVGQLIPCKSDISLKQSQRKSGMCQSTDSVHERHKSIRSPECKGGVSRAPEQEWRIYIPHIPVQERQPLNAKVSYVGCMIVCYKATLPSAQECNKSLLGINPRAHP